MVLRDGLCYLKLKDLNEMFLFEICENNLI